MHEADDRIQRKRSKTAKAAADKKAKAGVRSIPKSIRHLLAGGFAGERSAVSKPSTRHQPHPRAAARLSRRGGYDLQGLDDCLSTRTQRGGLHSCGCRARVWQLPGPF